MKFHSLALLVLMSILLTACGTPEKPPPPSATPLPPTEAPPPTEPPPTETLPLLTETPNPTETSIPALEPYTGAPRIVFSSNRGDDPNKIDLYLFDTGTAEITPLKTGFDAAILPSWSPDGNQVAFAVANVWNLYTIYADGTNLTQVTDFRSNNPDWAPDASQLVFQSDHQNEPQDTPDIYVINFADSALYELLDAPEFADYGPRWSGDGSQILFISNSTGNMEIFYMNPDGSEVTQVTDGADPVGSAAWSPDGERIVFVYGQRPATDLYIINKDGSVESVVRLTADEYTDDSPSFSPDGEQIVFSSNRSGNWDLWVVNADGTGLTQLTDDPFYDGFPDWSW